jgi:SAM-dependent methyltransferase
MTVLLRKVKTACRILREQGVGGVIKALEPYRKAMLSSSGRWKEGHSDELKFWDEYFRTRGLQWSADYASRLNPDTPLQPRPAALLPDAPETTILDVGAGPLTYLGKKALGKQLRITAIDPLADGYDAIMAKYAVEPPVRSEKLSGEQVATRFSPNTFDLIFARNCLDHAHDPVEAIRQMVLVAKRGGYVLLEHHPNEAENQQHEGLHQWNFTTNEGGEFLIAGLRGSPVNVSTRFQELVSTRCEYLDDGEKWLIVTMKKVV